MLNFNVLVVICLCVLASASHLKFPDEDFMEMKIETSGRHGLVGWFSAKDKATGEKKKIFFGKEKEKTVIKTEKFKDISIHCENDHHRVELDYVGNTEFGFLNTGSGSSMVVFNNGSHKEDVEKHTTYANLPTDCDYCTGTYICREQFEGTKLEPVQAHVEWPGK